MNPLGSLQPVAHALLQAREDVEDVLSDFPDTFLWERPAGVASVGFHLQHLSGVLDRLFTYARGEALNECQLKALATEGEAFPEGTTEGLLEAFHAGVEVALADLRTNSGETLLEHNHFGSLGQNTCD